MDYVVQKSNSVHEGTRKICKAVLRTLLILVFLGWLMLWVMLPTNTFSNSWITKLEGKANPTYLGRQGTNLVLFTFPMMFIAFFSCVYLYFEKTSYTQSTNPSSRLSFLRRPVMVRAPFGIVTAMELIFCAMFIVLLIWSFYNYVHVSFQHLSTQIWKAKLGSVSLILGYVGNICWAFLFFPVTRGSCILRMVGLTSESSIKYHIWLGHLSMILFTAHSVGFLFYWALTGQMYEMLEWSKDWVSNVAGEIALVFGLAMWITSLQRVRRKIFELFFYTHQLYALYLFFYVLHVGIPYFCTVLPGVFLFLIDRYLRFLQSWQRVQLISAQILPCEVVELNFSKSPGLHYTPTSIVFVNVPIISKLQWHPFTVASNSNSESDKLSIIIKSEGSWSQKLYERLSPPSSIDYLDISVEGPYGPSSIHFLRHDSLIMISGGSGITSMISVIREIVYQSTTMSCSIKQVHLVCAFKKYADLSMLDLLLPDSAVHLDISSIQLKIEAYITREKELPAEDTKNPHCTIWFKPNSTHTSLIPILGPKNWLWLGAIVSSSFIMFLLLLGILTQHYIYPIDKNTDIIYHFSGRALWDMLFICISIIIVASAVFLWNKTHDMSRMEIKNMDVPTPSTSPCSPFNKDDPEVGTVPRQSLVQATEVQFGARPDLKKILLNTKGSNVGVMVCGPKNMRHEVATICSSSLTDNLHFEGISFSW